MKRKTAKLLWYDDGNSFLCSDCGTVIPRTRMNPMPTHKCSSKPKRWADAAKRLAKRKEGP